MAKRYVIALDKIDGSEAVLNAETIRQLGIKERDNIAITSLTSFFIVPAVAGNVAVDQIRVPNKYALVKEGDRLGVEPGTAAAAPPQTASGGGGKSRDATTKAEDFSWDPVPDTAFNDVVGLTALKNRIEQSLYYLTHPEWFLIRKSLPPRVFLLFGPYGCGKTMLARAMASRLAYPTDDGVSLDIKLKIVKATDIKDPYLGMSARHIQQYLDAARQECNKGSTVLLVLDEIDSLVSTRTGGTHEEYRDIVNTFLQDVQGAKDLDAETRIRQLQHDAEVNSLRKELAALVRGSGRRDSTGDIQLPEKEWTKEIQERMLRLRRKVKDAGGVSTVIIVGTTNDPCRIDDGFISRAGDNVFFVSRPPAEAIEEMLKAQLDNAFVDLKDSEWRALAEEAFHKHLTGRDIMLSWLQPLRSMAPGSLTIMGYHTIKAHMPEPTMGIEWELDLYGRLKEKGQLLLAQQVEEYVNSIRIPWPAKKKGPDTAPSAAPAPLEPVGRVR